MYRICWYDKSITNQEKILIYSTQSRIQINKNIVYANSIGSFLNQIIERAWKTL